MKNAIIVSLKLVVPSATNKVKTNRIFVTTDQGTLWIPEAAFFNAAQTLATDEFINGTLSVEVLKPGTVLQNGQIVTEEGKLHDWLTLEVQRDELFAAKKAAAVESMKLAERERAMKIDAARRRAQYAADAAAGNETPEDADQPGEQQQGADANAGTTPVANANNNAGEPGEVVPEVAGAAGGEMEQ